ncbi:hypothetical protein V8G54_016773 [Vigna mungo]|uniref:Aminotransferase-like plant mobile domain-containing protein n=1 Tax=Vigna mungo TaxID=3915 RepID=A0AAQ3S0R8_VIGMU
MEEDTHSNTHSVPYINLPTMRVEGFPDLNLDIMEQQNTEEDSERMQLQNVEKQFETREHQNVEEHLETRELHNDIMQEENIQEDFVMMDLLIEVPYAQEHLVSMKLQNIATELENSMIEGQNALLYLECMALENILLEEQNIRENLIAMELVKRIMEKHYGQERSETMEQQQNDGGYLTTSEPQNVLLGQQNVQMDQQNDEYPFLTMEEQFVSEAMKLINVTEQFATMEQENVQENCAVMEDENVQEHSDIMKLKNVLMEIENTLIEEQNDQEHLDEIKLQKIFMEFQNIITEGQNVPVEEQNVSAMVKLENVTEKSRRVKLRIGRRRLFEKAADPWKIKKKLQEHDLKSWLLVPAKMAKRFLLPVINATTDEIKKGIKVGIWDVNTNTGHTLTLTKYGNSHILTINWIHDFIRRRDLRFPFPAFEFGGWGCSGGLRSLAVVIVGVSGLRNDEFFDEGKGIVLWVSLLMLTVRHSVSTKFTSSLNEHLSKEQRALIGGTPFGWFLDFSGNVKVGRKMLSELVFRWVDSSSGFLIADKVVPMNEKDICLALGLSLDGKEIDLNLEMGCSRCVKYIGNKTRDLSLVYKCLMKKRKSIPCHPFCSLYILVGICEILIPHRNEKVLPKLFEIVDNLNDLGNYCWDSLVYRCLVRGLNKASDALKKGKATTNVYVDGCIYMLQAWFFEKLIPPKGPIQKNPRILHWMNLKLGDNLLTRALETGVVNVDVDVDVGKTKEEKELKDEARGKNKDEKASSKKELKKNRRERFTESLHEQQSLVAELRRRVLVLEEEIAFEKKRRRRPQDGGENVPNEEPSLSPRGMSPGGQSEQGMSSGRPVKKTFVRMGSRRRYKSQALRTPYVGLLRKKLDFLGMEAPHQWLVLTRSREVDSAEDPCFWSQGTMSKFNVFSELVQLFGLAICGVREVLTFWLKLLGFGSTPPMGTMSKFNVFSELVQLFGLAIYGVREVLTFWLKLLGFGSTPPMGTMSKFNVFSELVQLFGLAICGVREVLTFWLKLVGFGSTPPMGTMSKFNVFSELVQLFGLAICGVREVLTFWLKLLGFGSTPPMGTMSKFNVFSELVQLFGLAICGVREVLTFWLKLLGFGSTPPMNEFDVLDTNLNVGIPVFGLRGPCQNLMFFQNWFNCLVWQFVVFLGLEAPHQWLVLTRSREVDSAEDPCFWSQGTMSKFNVFSELVQLFGLAICGVREVLTFWLKLLGFGSTPPMGTMSKFNVFSELVQLFRLAIYGVRDVLTFLLKLVGFGSTPPMGTMSKFNVFSELVQLFGLAICGVREVLTFWLKLLGFGSTPPMGTMSKFNVFSELVQLFGLAICGVREVLTFWLKLLGFGSTPPMGTMSKFNVFSELVQLFGLAICGVREVLTFWLKLLGFGSTPPMNEFDVLDTILNVGIPVFGLRGPCQNFMY